MAPSLAECQLCSNLQRQFRVLRRERPDYWNRPVASSGDGNAPLMIVGLAPGMHGANRTGIPFTGDASGELLFRTLSKLELTQKVQITNAVKCLPLKNRPSHDEITNCQCHLRLEVDTHTMKEHAVFLALGRVAHNAVLKARDLTMSHYPFVHGRHHLLMGGAWLVDSYHCSRYNTQTGRLTAEMFELVVAAAAERCGI